MHRVRQREMKAKGRGRKGTHRDGGEGQSGKNSSVLDY